MTVTIDGIPCACEAGEYLLDIAARNGVTIPSLCHHGGLPGQGCCRVCIVEVEQGGWKNIVAACIYPVERECAVFTKSERVIRQRGMVLSLLRAAAPESAEVARLCEVYDAPEYERFVKKPKERCILCGLCAKACQSLGTGAIVTVNRGVEKAVSTPYDEPSAVCAGCKSCAEVCPTGAVEVIEDGINRTIWGKSFPLKKCGGCGALTGTLAELERAADKAGAEIPALCNRCKKKSMSDVLASTYGW